MNNIKNVFALSLFLVFPFARVVADSYAFEENVRQMERVEFAAFPGAQGHGRLTVGGRGGKVYHVTNLQDDLKNPPVGSLRWAISQKGPRTVVFDVSGTIHLKGELRTGDDFITVAGQTSPGGICIADWGFKIDSNDVIIRFLRFRPGDTSRKEPDGLGGMDRKNVIVDHCSVSWSVDECISVYGMENSTVQWCIAGQALYKSTHSKGGSHGYGGNWGGNKASYHHNLIAHCESRVPRLGPRYTTQESEYVDIRNNVFYNWAGQGCYGGEFQNVNLVCNYYKPGPATLAGGKDNPIAYRIAKIGVRTKNYVTSKDGTPNRWYPAYHKWGKFYITGNVVEGNREVTDDNWTKGVYAQQRNDKSVDNLWTQKTMDTIKVDKPVIDDAGVTSHSAYEAYDLVLKYAGASNYRDEIDRLIVSDVLKGEASCTADGNKPGYINTQSDVLKVLKYLGGNPYPELKLDNSRSITDSDGDGMPDDFERDFGLNPDNISDGNEKTLDPEGNYTNLEMYLHYLVKDLFLF